MEDTGQQLTTDCTTECAASGGKVVKTEEDKAVDEDTDNDGIEEYILAVGRGVDVEGGEIRAVTTFAFWAE